MTDSEPRDESLAEAFWAVAHELRRRSLDRLAEWDITPSQSRALLTLARHGTMRLSDLARHLHIAARSATEVVDALEQRALVARRPAPDDRRATLLDLTDAAHDVLGQLRASRSSGADAYFSRLSDRDRATLARILRTLRE